LSSSRRAALAIISSFTSACGTPIITNSISFFRRTSIRPISRSAADRLARCSMRSRFISSVTGCRSTCGAAHRQHLFLLWRDQYPRARIPGLYIQRHTINDATRTTGEFSGVRCGIDILGRP
jgi:hypothetical protein